MQEVKQVYVRAKPLQAEQGGFHTPVDLSYAEG